MCFAMLFPQEKSVNSHPSDATFRKEEETGKQKVLSMKIYLDHNSVFQHFPPRKMLYFSL